MEMRTTDVRKLRPEAWGFICPVHTPDGAPCGLLNHVTASVRIVTHYSSLKQMPALLAELGVLSHSAVALMPTDEVSIAILRKCKLHFHLSLNTSFLSHLHIDEGFSRDRSLKGMITWLTKIGREGGICWL